MGAGDEDGSGLGQAGIFRQRDGLRSSCGGRVCRRSLCSYPRSGQPQISIAGEFPSTLAGAFGESTFVIRLHSPCDAFDQPRLIAGSRFVAADVGKLCPQFFDRHSRQCSDLVCQSLKLGFTVIPAQAGIQIAALVSRLRGNDVR